MHDYLFYKQVGKRIQLEREKIQMSREKLSEQAGISEKFLYEIENGRKGFACETFYKICDVLHVDPTYMLEGKNCPTDKTKIEYLIRDFDKKDMYYLIKMIEELCELRKHVNKK